MNSSWIRQDGAGIVLALRVVPRAAQDGVQGIYGDALKIRLRAPPVEGKANEALISFLSRKLEIPKRNIALKSGLNQRRKVVAVNGLSKSEVERRLLG